MPDWNDEFVEDELGDVLDNETVDLMMINWNRVGYWVIILYFLKFVLLDLSVVAHVLQLQIDEYYFKRWWKSGSLIWTDKPESL